MSAFLDKLVNIVITLTGPGLAALGFGTPLLISQSANYSRQNGASPSVTVPGWVERVRFYSSANAVLADFSATSPEYLQAVALFGQNNKPQQIAIGRASNTVVQQWTLSVSNVVFNAFYGIGLFWDGQEQVIGGTLSPTTGAWQANHTYNPGDICTNDTGKRYVCSAGGESAGSGGPTGNGSTPITDNTVTWYYAGTTDSQAGNDSFVYGFLDALGTLTDSPNFTQAASGSAGSKTLVLTATHDYEWFAVETIAPQYVFVTQSHNAPSDGGLVSDLAAINAEQSGWYALLTSLNSKAYVLAAASWVETNKKLYLPDTADTACAEVAFADGTDVGEALVAASRTRTGAFFHPRAWEFPAASEAGFFLPLDPGSENWRLKTLSGVTVGWGSDPSSTPPVKGLGYNDTESGNLDARLMNYYVSVGNVSCIFGNGLVAANEYIDVVRFIDWWSNQVQTDCFNALYQNNKLPETDTGVAVLTAAIRAVNAKGITQGGINPGAPIRAGQPGAPGIAPPSVIAAPVASLSPSDRAARKCPPISVSWTLAGAINSLTVNVTVLS